MLARVEPFWTWHTPIAWTGYILLLDGIIDKRRGNSWLTAHRREFVFLALVSIPLWLVFEGYNLLIENWHYINLPENLVVRYFGYAWAFATISPGIFLDGGSRRHSSRSRLASARTGCDLTSTDATFDCRLSTTFCVGAARRCLSGPSSGRRRIWLRPYFSASSSCSTPSTRAPGTSHCCAIAARATIDAWSTC